MARLALGVAGAVGGFFLGGPQGAAIGFQLGVAAGGSLFPEQLPDAFGPQHSDIKFTGAGYGQPIFKAWGTVRTSGTIIWGGEIQEREHRTTVESGGKGGGTKKQTQVTYSYDVDLAVAFAGVEVDQVLRVWADGKIIYDASGNATLDTVAGSSTFFRTMIIRKGTETQPKVGRIAADVGSANCPAFRGIFFIFFRRLELNNFGYRIPNFTCEFRVTSDSESVSTLSQGTAFANSAAQGYLNDTQFNIVDSTTVGDYFMDAAGRMRGMYFTKPASQYTVVKASQLIAAGTVIYQNWERTITLQYPLSTSAGNGGIGGLWAMSPENRAVYGGYYTADFLSSPPYSTLVLVDFDEGRDKQLSIPDLSVLTSMSGSPVTGHSGAIYGQYIYFILAGNSSGWCITRYDITSRDHGGELLGNSSGFWWQTSYYGIDDEGFYIVTTLGAGGGDAILYEFEHGNDTPVNTYTITGGAGIVSTSGDYNLHSRIFRQENVFYFIEQSSSIHRYDAEADSYSNIGSSSVTLGRNFWWRPGLIGGTVNAGGSTSKLTYSGYGIGSAVEANIADVISDICELTGLASGDIDVTGITGTTEGFILTRPTTGRAAISSLLDAYNKAAYENGTDIVFTDLGGSSVVTITDDDLGGHPLGETLQAKLETTRIPDKELPRVTRMSFMDPARDYDTNEAEYSRLITNAVNVDQRQYAIAMTPTEARNSCEIRNLREWIGRMRHRVYLTDEYIYLDPTDTITITADSVSVEMTVLNMNVAGQLITIDAMQSAAATYSPNTTGVDGLDFKQRTPISRGPTILEILDIPTLRPLDLDIGLYVAVCGVKTAWSGAALFRSATGGETWDELAAITSETVIGIATTALSTAAFYEVFDRVNTVTVKPADGTALSSAASELAVLNGANVAVLGDEIIQFKDVTDNGDGTYTLSTLLRGRRGTDGEMASHAKGERFVLIQADGMLRISLAASDRNATRRYLAVSIGEEFNLGGGEDFTFTAESSLPLSPVHAKGARDGSLNFTGTFIRRVRGNTEWVDGADAPLDEDSESYEIDVMNGSTVVRTIEVTAESFSYTAAQQITDWGSEQASIEFNIYQISPALGDVRGEALNVTL